MELSNEFEVPVPIEQAWSILTDIERIAPCLPGAQLQEVEGEHYRGIVKVKVGPITAQYKGQATMVDKDDANHKAMLQATGRDTRGAGNASANISAELTEAGERTHVSVLTDLTVTGKVAQFGRGVLADVSAKLLDQFVANLEATVLAEELAIEGLDLELEAMSSDDPIVAAVAAEVAEEAFEAAEALVDAVDDQPDVAEAPSAVRRIDAPEAEPVDLLGAAGAPVGKRLVGVAAVITALALVFGLGRRRRRRRRRAA
jgi:carbon monoxide dehydrogenase subunit G